MGNWKLWHGIFLCLVVIVYMREVTIQTEKIQSSRRRGRIRMILLGIPLIGAVVLALVFWHEIQLYWHYLNR